MAPRVELTAKIEPFDSFWEAPEDIAKGYRSFYQFYRRNYFPCLPADRQSRILVVSCGPGDFVNLLPGEGCPARLGIRSDLARVEHPTGPGLPCRAERVFPFLE